MTEKAIKATFDQSVIIYICILSSNSTSLPHLQSISLDRIWVRVGVSEIFFIVPMDTLGCVEHTHQRAWPWLISLRRERLT